MCGVAGYTTLRINATPHILEMLELLQDRGQSGSGIAVCKDGDIHARTKSGPVSNLVVGLDLPDAHCGIGHVRYATSGSKFASQPLTGAIAGTDFALCTNGDTVKLNGKYRDEFRMSLQQSVLRASSDTEDVLHLIAQQPGTTFLKRLVNALKKIEGAFSTLVLLKTGVLIATRDRWGFRPLFLAKREDAVAFASEPSALVDFTLIREVKPGEMVIVNPNLAIHSQEVTKPARRQYRCSFEWVYMMRPDNPGVYPFRRAQGRTVAIEMREKRKLPEKIDGVVAVFDSGRDAAFGFAGELGLEVIPGLNRARRLNTLRAFLGEDEGERNSIAQRKHSANPDAVSGKHLIVVDDSLLRSTTMKVIVRKLRDAGAASVHVVIVSPPIGGPCFYGTNIPTRQELVASNRSESVIRILINADSLTYISLEGYRSCYEHITVSGYEGKLKPCKHVCDACMSGLYPKFVPHGFAAKKPMNGD